ncbi:hypothetical protein FB45DRAFT_1060953 [Roridomyces roridus]|uniref:DUF6532 domain-containing protein n=1 Tax=Roridomyces roridus TaxID=1738132 RepID=A0AAD7BMF0_9AGAR|nr:hypothetical protein FB45DRAFT_1060953 [Roridomyces roridus]
MSLNQAPAARRGRSSHPAPTAARPTRAADEITREVLSLAITFYCCFLSARDAFPDQATEMSFVKEAWDTACYNRNVDIELTPTLSKLMTNRGSHLRGELKTKIKPMVELMFGFKSGQNKKTIKANRDLTEKLKDDLTFTFKDIAARKGIYRNPLFQKAVNAMWFVNTRDEAVTQPQMFNPFPLPGFALVITVTEHLIDEWATGIRSDIPFTAHDYRDLYQTHINALRRFEEKTEKYGILDNILVRLHNIGRHPITHHAPQPAITDATIAAAILEYQEDEETETDGEDGDDA